MEAIIPADVKLEDLEVTLANNENEVRDNVSKQISEAYDEILPLRLQFNDFIQTMASIDQGGSRQGDRMAKYLHVRDKILQLNDRFQSLSSHLETLQPLFGHRPGILENRR